MNNILLISTGGTIGSTMQAGTINTNDSAQLKLLQLFAQQDPHPDIQFHCRQPIQILSENLAPCVWQTLIGAIEQENLENYTGIIITHGTDTLAYTTCALSFYFHALKIPLLLVSSDYPLHDARANGLDNFRCAIAYIRQNLTAGVFVPYRNQQQTMQLHQGLCLTSSLQLSSDFYSVQNKPFMQFANGEFTACHPLQPTTATPLKAQFSARILLIKPYPNLDYDCFNLHGIDAVLHDLYHSGTACVTTQWGEQHSLISFIKKCRAENIPVYMAPAIYSEEAYQSTHELLDQGVIMLWDISIEAAYVKLLLAYSNFNDPKQINDFMKSHKV